jgi:ABC-type oligopeptide transport system, periplasmic component
MLKRYILFLFLFTSPLVFVSCSPGDDKATSSTDEYSKYSDAKSVDGDWLIYNLTAEPGTLNPITATDAYESTINGGNIYETLVKRDNKTLKIVPLLADSWEISEDKLTYIFPLKKELSGTTAFRLPLTTWFSPIRK